MKRGKKNAEVMTVNIGSMITEKIKEQKIYKSNIAQKMGRQETAIFPMLKRPSMQTTSFGKLVKQLGIIFFTK